MKLAKARSRRGANLAAGKLGVVKAPGKAAYPVPILAPAFARRFEFLTWNQCSVSLVLLSLAVSGLL